ncbi:Gibberellin 2-beta-dioxygenase 1 [Stylosanthes scabra]|uniref:Gibberellin 2-beta-dioxygenase 1 n=1 Tax=Stylosanthes scabra TaxID=79078 RepID=A0ABU6RR35_9FABA|nr:Gibberellin 2-beta-dioxygenase 1 [Stylosanthes scabra]
MVVLSKQTTEQYSCIRKTATFPTPIVPVVDLSKPEDAKSLIVKACEDFGFFKVINHGVPVEAISKLESEAAEFFSLPLNQKEKAGTPNPFGYGNKKIGRNGDVGWVEYLLLTNNHDYNFMRLTSVFGPKADQFRNVMRDYMGAVRNMACVILELMAGGLKIEQKNVFSKMMMDKESDSIFRLNHYPPCPDKNFISLDNNGEDVIGFGEHTDPQIISLLRSNNTSGLQICLRDRSWVSVPPDQNSFFVNVGDSLQVLTNGRFRSVRHRVLANGFKSRLSMIYFCGPPLTERIAPLPSLLLNGNEESLYKEFTWFEHKSSAYNTRLADNRLRRFERITAS